MALLRRTSGGGGWWASLWRGTWGIALLALAGAGLRAEAQPAATVEYQLKAAFLYKLTLFVEWPAAAFPAEKNPLVIGVLGDDPFGSYLDDLVKGEKIDDHLLVVRRFRRVEEIGECHMLFISRTSPAELEKILGQLGHRSILTVADMDGFADAGGMVRFLTEAGKIQLRINHEAAKAADLILSSKILSRSTIVTPRKK